MDADEIERILFGNKKLPNISIKSGNNVGVIPDRMMFRDKIGAVPIEVNSNILFKMTNKQKKELPLFSFCIKNKLTACVLDIESGVSMKMMQKTLKEFAYLAYHSASSILEKPRLRFIIPFTSAVKADDYEFAKDDLMTAFDNVPDIHSFESSRFFFVPSRYCGQYREENEIIAHEGRSFDFYSTFDINPLEVVKKKMNKAVNTVKKSVIDDERVQYYLSNDFPLMQGNGDSASSLFTAICVCLSHQDEDALEEVLEKARSERWSEKELERNIKQAKKFLKL